MHFPPLPPLFDRIPSMLFNPLSGALAPVYWTVLARFYQYEFETEPFHIVKPVALEIAEDILRNSPEWLERKEILLQTDVVELSDSESVASDDPHRDGARRIVSKLEHAGWYHFEYRSEMGHVLNFYPYAARILDTLVSVARDEQPLFQGYAHSIATLLKIESFVPRPGVALSEAKRNTLELVRELKILNRNIFHFTQHLIEQVQTASGVLEAGLDRYRQAIQANYHRLKTVDNLYRWRSDILLRLDAIERDSVSLANAALWYAEQRSVDRESAETLVKQDLRVMRTQFETLPQVTDDIDRRNARFSGVALRKLMYLLQQDKRIEGQLQQLIDALAQDKSPELDLESYRCELLAEGFLYTNPRQRRAAEPHALALPPLPDREKVRAAAAALIRSPYTRARILAYVDEILDGRGTLPLREIPLDCDEDYIRRIFIVAFGLDGAANFGFRPAGNGNHPSKERHGIYGYPSGQVERHIRKRR
jgi:hypothetical protein